jgi:hypothetical protein
VILLDPAIGIVVFHAIKFQNPSGKTKRGTACPEEEEREIAARGQEREGLDVVRFEEFLVFASVLATNPEAAVPCPRAIAITAALNGKRFPSFVCMGKTVGMQTGALGSIADGGIDGNGFDNFGEEVWRDGNLRISLPFAARISGRNLPFAWRREREAYRWFEQRKPRSRRRGWS